MAWFVIFGALFLLATGLVVGYVVGFRRGFDRGRRSRFPQGLGFSVEGIATKRGPGGVVTEASMRSVAITKGPKNRDAVLRGIISSETPDRDGNIVRQDGIDWREMHMWPQKGGKK